MKMKAALMYEPLKIVIRDDIDVPKPGENEILVRVKAVGVCPSDVRFYTGERLTEELSYGESSYGLLGHEWSGEVVEIGKGVDNISVGDFVACDHLVYCGKCRYCGMGLTNLCMNKKWYLRGYAEYALAYAPFAYKLSRHVQFEEACFAEPIACVLNANRITNVKPGDIVLVVGAGPMGLLHAQIAKLSGATVIISDIIKERVEFAKKIIGVDVAVNASEEDLSKVVKEVTDNIGVDKAIVSIGNRTAIEQAIPLVRKRGIVVLFGGTFPPDKISIDPNMIHYNEIILTGSHDHIREDFRRAIELISHHKIMLAPLISHKFKLNDLVKAFETVRAKRGLKVIVYP